MIEPRICELWLAIAKRCGEVFGKPLPRQQLELGSREREWGIVFNASDDDDPKLPRYSVSVSWGGLPVGLIEPNGGIIAAGSAANEQTFRAWLSSAVPCPA